MVLQTFGNGVEMASGFGVEGMVSD